MSKIYFKKWGIKLWKFDITWCDMWDKKPCLEICFGEAFLSIKKAKDCIFSRRNGYRGKIIFGYSILFYTKLK